MALDEETKSLRVPHEGEYYFFRFETDVQVIFNEVSRSQDAARVKVNILKGNIFLKGDYFIPLKSADAFRIACDELLSKLKQISCVLDVELDSNHNLTFRLKRGMVFRAVLEDVTSRRERYGMFEANKSVLVLTDEEKEHKSLDDMRNKLLAEHIIWILTNNGCRVSYSNFRPDANSRLHDSRDCSCTCKCSISGISKDLEDKMNISDYKSGSNKCLDDKMFIDDNDSSHVESDLTIPNPQNDFKPRSSTRLRNSIENLRFDKCSVYEVCNILEDKTNFFEYKIDSDGNKVCLDAKGFTDNSNSSSMGGGRVPTIPNPRINIKLRLLNSVDVPCSCRCSLVNVCKDLEDKILTCEYRTDSSDDETRLDAKRFIEDVNLSSTYGNALTTIILTSEDMPAELSKTCHVKHVIRNHLRYTPDVIVHVTSQGQNRSTLKAGVLLTMVGGYTVKQVYIFSQSVQYKGKSSTVQKEDMSSTQSVGGRNKEGAVSDCTAQPEDEFSAGVTSCTAQHKDKFSAGTTSCTAQPEDEFSAGTTSCTAQPEDKFSAGITSCTAQPEDKFSAGVTSCTVQPEDKFSAGVTRCTAQHKDKFSAGTTSCTAQPEDEFSAGVSSCTARHKDKCSSHCKHGLTDFRVDDSEDSAVNYSPFLGQFKTSQSTAGAFIDAHHTAIEMATALKYDMYDPTSKAWSSRVRSLTDAAVKFDVLKQNHSSVLNLRPPSGRDGEKTFGVFVQYNHARLANLFRNFDLKVGDGTYLPLCPLEDADFGLLELEEEWHLFSFVLSFPVLVKGVVESLVGTGDNRIRLNRVCLMLQELCGSLSLYYGRIRILGGTTPRQQGVMHARLWMLRGILQVFRNAFQMLDIEGLDLM